LALLAPTHPWTGLLLAAAGVGAIIAGAGALWPSTRPMPRVLSILTFAAAANVAVIHALGRVVLGHEDHLWEPTRRTATPVGG